VNLVLFAKHEEVYINLSTLILEDILISSWLTDTDLTPQPTGFKRMPASTSAPTSSKVNKQRLKAAHHYVLNVSDSPNNEIVQKGHFAHRPNIGSKTPG
jgi:hypothetical protein